MTLPNSTALPTPATLASSPGATSSLDQVQAGSIMASPPGSSFVQVEGLYKSFNQGETILQNIEFSARPGEFISFLGPSGCGKSTLLRLICGLTSPTAGSITIDNKTPAQARQELSFVFQEATLLPWRTVERNIGLNLELAGVPRLQRQGTIESLMELVGLKDYAKFYPHELSGGMKMRVSIARALARSPKVLLMDEPFAPLDEMTRHRLNEELLGLQDKQKWSAFFVTHSVAEAVFLSHRILVLAARPGRIVHDIRVDLPFPRTHPLRSSQEFLGLVGRVAAALSQVAP